MSVLGALVTEYLAFVCPVFEYNELLRQILAESAVDV
jgi:hypothetical protein